MHSKTKQLTIASVRDFHLRGGICRHAAPTLSTLGLELEPNFHPEKQAA